VLRVVLSAAIVLVSSAFVFLLALLLRRISHRTRFSRRRAYQAIGIVFVAVLMSFNYALPRALSHGSTLRANDPAGHLSLLHPALEDADWSTYHNDNAHTGYVADEPDPHQLLTAWKKNLDGAVYAEPLVIGGHVIVATEGDSIYSLDADTGQIQWHTTVGHSVPISTVGGCGGNIDPLGITGTPVYDPASGLLFAVAEVAGPIRHMLVGVDVNTGQIRVQRSVDMPQMNPPAIYMQRPALALSNDMVYMGFGTVYEGCGIFRGMLVAAQTDGTGPLLSYQVPTRDAGGGIWGASGPVVDGQGQLYVSTADEEHVSSKWDLSNAVLRLSPTLQLEDSFAPTDWLAQDTGNQDLGSMGPSLLPGGFVFIAGKAGTGYLLHANALGGIGGQAAMAQICNGLAMGGTATVGSQIFVPCSDGLRCVLIEPGPKLVVHWHVSPDIALPPIVGGNTVYSLDQDGTLYALDIATGTVRATLALGAASPHFATPTISDGRVFVGTMQGVVAVSLA
jgi:outer membrane protein assembly factor BamB